MPTIWGTDVAKQAYIAYKSHRFNDTNKAMIVIARDIIEDYKRQGFKLTLRQIYYQFVARDYIENSERAYKNLGKLISNARLAGLIDWLAIEDRTRSLRSQPHWDSPSDILRQAAKQFQVDKWKDQDNHVEVWIEKDALVGILERVCNRLDVSIMSCRGYGSQSMMWESAQRLLEHDTQNCYIIHFGDHDPSGIDMTRDINDRLFDFGVENLEVRRVALTMDQVDEYGPPPNPTKVKDSRAGSYMAEYGDKSWELDALEPKVLEAIVEEHVMDLMDVDEFNDRIDHEQKQRERIKKVAAQLNKEDRE